MSSLPQNAAKKVGEARDIRDRTPHGLFSVSWNPVNIPRFLGGVASFLFIKYSPCNLEKAVLTGLHIECGSENHSRSWKSLLMLFPSGTSILGSSDVLQLSLLGFLDKGFH